jgi:spore maturation protein CgeB
MESFIEESVFLQGIPGQIVSSGKPFTILCAMMTYDYGKRKQGYSFEENNFFHSLLHLGYRVIKFDFVDLTERFGRTIMNKMLYEVALRYNPDLVFTALYTDQFDQETLKRIASELKITTFNWFFDDVWRFDTYSRYWAHCFTWVATTDKPTIQKYRDIGYTNVIHTQYACNHFLYKKLPLEKIYDVTFIGQPHGDRKEIISKLKVANIKVQVWGQGWPEGRVSQAEMIRIFNQSKINLNLSKTSLGTVDQIKGRDFEIPGCGGFLITGYSDDIHDYYKLNDEIVCYKDFDELLDKIRFYLQHDSIREKIAQAGYERTLREHTYEKRFSTIFGKIF